MAGDMTALLQQSQSEIPLGDATHTSKGKQHPSESALESLREWQPWLSDTAAAPGVT